MLLDQVWTRFARVFSLPCYRQEALRNGPSAMEIQRPTRYPLRGRVQLALPDQRVLAGNAVDISIGGLCVVLDRPIAVGALYPLRFEMNINGGCTPLRPWRNRSMAFLPARADFASDWRSNKAIRSALR